MGSTYYSTQSCHANECVGRHEDHQHLIEDRFVHWSRRQRQWRGCNYFLKILQCRWCGSYKRAVRRVEERCKTKDQGYIILRWWCVLWHRYYKKWYFCQWKWCYRYISQSFRQVWTECQSYSGKTGTWLQWLWSGCNRVKLGWLWRNCKLGRAGRCKALWSTSLQRRKQRCFCNLYYRHQLQFRQLFHKKRWLHI